MIISLWMKIGYGSCPGTCGELVQGYIGKNEYISSYCVDLYSRAIVSEKKSNKKFSRPRKSKSIEASALVFEHFGMDKNQVENIHISIRSNIPIGKGMASSTADIGACIMATLDYLDKDMSPDEISRLVAKIEPTDSIFYPEVCIFDPINGERRDSLGYIPYKKILILEPENRINTMKIRGHKEYYKILRENKSITQKSFEMLSYGIKNQDKELLKRACENSALANESIKKTPYLRELIKLSRECQSGFLNISHTGTVVGISIDERTDTERLIHEIKNSEISSVYKKQYIRNIVKGGLRKGKLK
ncbi:MAG: cobalamin biosynthesis protein [Peptostreptococcus sp.]